MTERPFDTQSADESSTWEPVADDGATAAPVAQGTSSSYTTGTLTGSSTGHSGTGGSGYSEHSGYSGRSEHSGHSDSGSTGGASDTKQVVADEAASVAQDAKQGGKQVAETAASEAKNVAAEAASQGKQLFSSLRTELTDQVSSQNQRAAGGLRALADELHQMGSGSEQKGLASDLASQASERVRSVAGWLEGREPADLLQEVRTFARRRPGAFLAAAAAIGVIGGRLTRGMTGDDTSTSQAATTGGTYSGGGAAYPGSGSATPGTYSTAGTYSGGNAAYASDAPVGAGTVGGTAAGVGTSAFGADYVYETDPVLGSDATRVDTDIDATSTYPASGTDTGDLGRERR